MEVKQKRIDKKILIGLLVLLGVLMIFLAIYFFCIPRFRIQSFEAEIEIPYQSEFAYSQTDVCFGTIFHCEEVTPKETGEVDTSKLGTYKVTYTYE